MTDFNYQKAYCVQALPAFENLTYNAKNVHSKLIPLVGELNQNRALNIPMTPVITELIESLTTKEIAELSRASYFVGHWQPSLLPSPFENKRGESWKITNCCDQVLRKRLSPPSKIEIHEGKLRVTFSNRYCWLWEEFALATEENLEIFKTCNLPFGESTLDRSANTLKQQINDLWPDNDTMPDNDLYTHYLSLKQGQKRQTIIDSFNAKIKRLEQDKIDAQKEIDFLLLCNDHNIDTGNVIYYSHTDTFCFGWNGRMSDNEKKYISDTFAGINHNYKISFK